MATVIAFETTIMMTTTVDDGSGAVIGVGTEQAT